MSTEYMPRSHQHLGKFLKFTHTHTPTHAQTQTHRRTYMCIFTYTSATEALPKKSSCYTVICGLPERIDNNERRGMVALAKGADAPKIRTARQKNRQKRKPEIWVSELDLHKNEKNLGFIPKDMCDHKKTEHKHICI